MGWPVHDFHKKRGKRGICFTINNATGQDIDNIQSMYDRNPRWYFIVGREIGKEGTPHLQGFLYMTDAKTARAFDKAFPECNKWHLEFAVTTEEAITYCMKDGDFTEWGDRPKTKSEKGWLIYR